jgi:hypothetical protein
MIGAQVILGLGLGAAITEFAFRSRDDGAFPHVNFYVADAELGVRLEPGASMRFQLRKNPLTTIHVNGRGYRGDDWPAPAEGEVIVVGDSQVFGLGVEDGETFSAVMSEKTGRTVLNGGVPTYGPQEYMAVARELLAERRASAVVVVLNFVNDPFELDRPNRERHAVWDGWAVRSETAPAEVREFPGRRWLFSRSHAVYALRRYLHARGTAAAPEAVELGDPIDLGTPSEGGLHDLVRASQKAHDEATTSHQSAVTALAASKTRLDQLDGELASKQKALEGLIIRASEGEFSRWDSKLAGGRPGDIVEDERAEASRSVVLTAALIQKAAEKRAQHLDALLREEARKGKREALELVKAEGDLLSERRRLREQLAAGAPAPARPASMFRDYLREFKALCDRHGAELVVVALPIDVQVDPREWAKYGVADPPDLSDSQILLDDLVADARELGLRALDATAALRAAEPGAFLDHDIHMTPKGHAAFAEALAATLAAPVVAPLRLPAGGLPEGRSFVPVASEWAASDEVLVRGSTAAGCSTQIRREWLRVQCRRRKPGDRFLALEVREGATPATMAMRTADALSLVTPLTPGAPLTARFHWKSGAQDLEIRWPAGADGEPKFHGAFTEVAQAAAPPEAPLGAALGLCACHQQLNGEQFCLRPGNAEEYDEWPEGCRPACGDLWGDPRLAADCERAFPGDCAGRLACVQNDPLFAPPCPEGQVHAFAGNACFSVCDDAHPCAAGTCTDWQGGGVCV